jgi:hypothetical protein
MASLTLTQAATHAMQRLGVLDSGEAPSSQQLTDALACANQMLESWLLDEMLVYARRADLYTLQAGVQQYTIGPAGATFTAARPTAIEEANIVLNTVTPVVRMPVEIVSDQRWAAIALQALPYAIPQLLFYDKGFDPVNGFGTLNLWPGPQTNYQLELYTWQQLQQFTDTVTSYNLPPGYARLVTLGLAIEWAPDFGVEPSATLRANYEDARLKIETYNAPDPVLEGDPAYASGGGSWNYALGTNGRIR